MKLLNFCFRSRSKNSLSSSLWLKSINSESSHVHAEFSCPSIIWIYLDSELLHFLIRKIFKILFRDLKIKKIFNYYILVRWAKSKTFMNFFLSLLLFISKAHNMRWKDLNLVFDENASFSFYGLSIFFSFWRFWAFFSKQINYRFSW